MIMSLGGSPEPLKTSINAHHPERIFFLASHDSIALAGEILKGCEPKPAAVYEITDDPNSMFESYKAARRCVDRAVKAGALPEEVVIDYTGGTKVMTAALILATIGRPYRFNYVGGEQRNKNGLGTVIDGCEKMFAEMNPWSVFAEEERRQVVTLFNRRRYSAVDEIIRIASERELPREIEEYFRFIRPLAAGFLFWEQFSHEKAEEAIGKGLKHLNDYLRNCGDSQLGPFATTVGRCKEQLDRIIRETSNLKKLHPILVDDLLNNARRRLADGRCDDAAARIYRALELYGQIEFERVAGCLNSNVPKDAIPETLRDEFISRYADPQSGAIKLPLHATFRYLKETGQASGERYFGNLKAIKKIQSSRNDSILAHGINPVSDNAGRSIFETVSRFVQFQTIFDFPVLP